MWKHFYKVLENVRIVISKATTTGPIFPATECSSIKYYMEGNSVFSPYHFLLSASAFLGKQDIVLPLYLSRL